MTATLGAEHEFLERLQNSIRDLIAALNSHNFVDLIPPPPPTRTPPRTFPALASFRLRPLFHLLAHTRTTLLNHESRGFPSQPSPLLELNELFFLAYEYSRLSLMDEDMMPHLLREAIQRVLRKVRDRVRMDAGYRRGWELLRIVARSVRSLTAAGELSGVERREAESWFWEEMESETGVGKLDGLVAMVEVWAR